MAITGGFEDQSSVSAQRVQLGFALRGTVPAGSLMDSGGPSTQTCLWGHSLTVKRISLLELLINSVLERARSFL